MRISATILVILSMLFLLASVSCGGGGSTQSQPPRAETTNPAPATPVAAPPAVVELIDISGTDVQELIDKWVEVGGDKDSLVAIFDFEPNGDYKPIYEWRISEIEKGNIDEFEIELKAGQYWLDGLGSADLTHLNLYVYGPDPENEEDSIASDTAEDTFKVMYFEIEEDQTVTIKVDPVGFAPNIEKAKYCWFIYEEN